MSGPADHTSHIAGLDVTRMRNSTDRQSNYDDETHQNGQSQKCLICSAYMRMDLYAKAK